MTSSVRFPGTTTATQLRKTVLTAALIVMLALSVALVAVAGISAVFSREADAVVPAPGISRTQPNVHEDQAMPVPGVSNTQPNVHEDQR